MAKPYKRHGSPFYWADIWYAGKKRSISLKTSNYGIARAKLHDRLASLQHGGLQLPTTTAVGAILEKFIQYRRANGQPKSVQTEAYRLREIFGAVCPTLASATAARSSKSCDSGSARGRRTKTKKTRKAEYALAINFLEEVTTAMISDFLVTIRNARGLDPKTVNEYREIVHRFFAWSIERHGVRMPGGHGQNPVSSVKRMRVSQPTIRFLRSVQEIHHQLDVLAEHPQIQTMIAVLIYGGLRRSEMLHLTPDDVSISRRQILIQRKRVLGTEYRTKTGRNRCVPISHALLSFLCSYRPPEASPWYFPSPTGALWDGDNFSHRLATLNQSAGLVWNCLDFRHTFGSHLAMKGESLAKIAELMGNSPEICRRHYVVLLPERMTDVVEFDEPSCRGPSSIKVKCGACHPTEAASA